MNKDLKFFYTRRLENYTKLLISLKRKIALIGWLRLFSFAIICLTGYFYFSTYLWFYLAIALISLSSFLFLLVIQQKQFDKKEIIENLILINQNEINQLNSKPSCFDAGSEFIDNHIYTTDLDIFGPRSVFHTFNRTVTQFGKEKFAFMLKNPFDQRNQIEKQQEGCKEFSEMVELRQMMLAHGLRIQKQKPDYEILRLWIDSPDFFTKSKTIRFLRIILPILFILSVMVFIVLPQFYNLISTIFLINLLISGLYHKSVSKLHQAVTKNSASFSVFSGVLRLVNQEKYTSEKLIEIQNNTLEADKQFKYFSVLGNFLDQRMNLLIYILLNGILLYDIQCSWFLEKWKKKNKAHIFRWLSVIAELEVLNSMATFAFNNSEFIYPKITESKPYIKAKNMSHPQISLENRVSNDIEIGTIKNIYLITGSNMSGKSTFLRSVGVNMALARCGMPVCASFFECSPMEIYSSLRVSDSLQDHVSLFFAELKKLQLILQNLTSGSNALVLLDEILKGTNSDDKHHGCHQLIKKLLNKNCIVLLATHDVELTQMEQEYPEKIDNYCFESTIINNELTFDYKLKKGISQNRNATFLLQRMGIID